MSKNVSKTYARNFVDGPILDFAPFLANLVIFFFLTKTSNTVSSARSLEIFGRRGDITLLPPCVRPSAEPATSPWNLYVGRS